MIDSRAKLAQGAEFGLGRRGDWKMENSMSRILIETVVRKTLQDMKESPERSIRNLVDMALHFSGGRFQKNFFQAAQTMLKNENSSYYALLRNAASSVHTERLVHFGMNLGYNSCTWGAKKIRENERELAVRIPWTAAFQTNEPQFSKNLPKYHTAVTDGERLGIYAWMLLPLSHPQKLLPLIHEHPDSAFFLFCDSKDISASFLDCISDINNLMLVIRYEETAGALYNQIRDNGLLYSAYCTYSQEDIGSIVNGDLFRRIQQALPVFTVLLAHPDCPKQARTAAYQAVKQARNEQLYCTVPWEFYFDNQLIDKIISESLISNCCPRFRHFSWFDSYGNLYSPAGKREPGTCNLFTNGLFASFQSASAVHFSAQSPGRLSLPHSV